MLAPDPPIPPNPPDPQAREAFDRAMSEKPMVATILVRDPSDPDVSSIAPGQWEELDDLVARRGTIFTEWDRQFDIGGDVVGLLGMGKVALLVLQDPSAPRSPTPQEAGMLGIPVAE